MFEQMRGKELLTCRSVCKKWNILAIPFTRIKCSIQIYGNQNIHGKISLSLNCGQTYHYPEGTRRTITNFVKTFNSNELGILFLRFRLGSFVTSDGPGQKFLKLCGDTIKEIHFFDEIFYIEDVYEILRSSPKLELFQIPQKIYSHSYNIVKLFPQEGTTPKLSSLKTLRICQDYSVIREQYCPTFFLELLTATENISSLLLWDLFPGDIRYSSSLEVLTVIEKLGRESIIQNLHISDVLSEHMEILCRMVTKRNGMKLRELGYINTYSIERNTCPIQLAELFKDTLQRLYIGDKCASFKDVPTFPQLKELSIQVTHDFNTRSVELNKIFPVLQRLSLQPIPYERVRETEHNDFLSDSDPSPIMQSLEVVHIYLKINGFRQILKVFPQLTELRLNVKDDGVDILREIYCQMPQLKKLHICGRIVASMESMDSFLTGIPIQTIQENPDMLKDVDKLTVELRRETILKLRNEHCRLPSITNLKSLRHLDLFLSVEGVEGEERKMTDLSGYLALYPMNCFRHIFTRNTEFTESCLQILKSDLGLNSHVHQTYLMLDIA